MTKRIKHFKGFEVKGFKFTPELNVFKSSEPRCFCHCHMVKHSCSGFEVNPIKCEHCIKETEQKGTNPYEKQNYAIIKDINKMNYAPKEDTECRAIIDWKIAKKFDMPPLERKKVNRFGKPTKPEDWKNKLWLKFDEIAYHQNINVKNKFWYPEIHGIELIISQELDRVRSENFEYDVKATCDVLVEQAKQDLKQKLVREVEKLKKKDLPKNYPSLTITDYLKSMNLAYNKALNEVLEIIKKG